MALRKHIGGGHIEEIIETSSDAEHMTRGLERIIVMRIAHRGELGDMTERYLVTELMGKHSNIILLSEDLTVIDSIKHISGITSSLREVLPGRKYFIPEELRKADPFTLRADEGSFISLMREEMKGISIYKKQYLLISGLSPLISGELLYRAGIDHDMTVSDMGEGDLRRLYGEFCALMDLVAAGDFAPNIIYENDSPAELAAIRITSLSGGDFHAVYFDSASEAVERFYLDKDKKRRLKADSEDLSRALKGHMDRAVRKLSLLEKELTESMKMDQYKLYGELLYAYGYDLTGGEKYLECENYHDGGKPIRIPLDKDLSSTENADRYYEKYNKLKRRGKYLREQIAGCEKSIYELKDIEYALSLADNADDIADIREEMRGAGLIKSSGRKAHRPGKSSPLHFVSSDGIDIYVGKNNRQNEEISFGLADPDDWWFHAKNVPGSHVIAKTGKGELPDRTCLEAAALAAYYSSAGGDRDPHARIEVDYIQRKELKHVKGAPAGYVIYHSNYSLMIEPRAAL